MSYASIVRAGLVVVIITMVVGATPRPATARKQYLDAFLRKYSEAVPQAKAAKCAVCHGEKKKQERSKYAELLADELLGLKNVKNPEEIEAALDVVVEKEVNCMTYKQRIDAGMLPPAFPN